MSIASKITKSFSMEKQLLEQIERTRGTRSTSERVNQLLKTALETERRESLHIEAARFFKSDMPEERKERKAFQAASIKSITRG